MKVELFVRDGCHLCEAFLEEFEQFLPEKPIQLQIQDVDSSDEWIQCYGEKVPVLLIDGDLVCEYFFDSEKVFPYFKDEK